MDGQAPVWMHHSVRSRKNEDTSGQIIAVHKSTEQPFPLPAEFCCKGQNEAEIHGDAAKLKWKIPPVVFTAIDLSLIHISAGGICFPYIVRPDEGQGNCDRN